MDRKYFENEFVELKKSTSELPAALEDIVAILNKHQGGTLYFGIKDDGTVLGQQIGSETLRDVTNRIHNKIEPRISPDVYIEKIDGKDVIVVKFSGNNGPYSADGRYFIRVGDESNKLNASELDDLFVKFSKNRVSWEEDDSGHSIIDVDEGTLKKFVDKGKDIGRIKGDYSDIKTVLENLELICDNGNLKNAGYVLFGKNINLNLRVAIFATEEKSTILDMQEFKGNIFKLIEDGMLYVSQHIMWTSNFKTGKLNRMDIPEIPLVAIREILLNSYVHRQWGNNFDNHIAIYKDRIEIDNPGNFYSDANPWDYINKKASSKLRNPLIAKTIYKSGEIETWGTGIKKVYDNCKSVDVKVDFINGINEFFVVFYRKNYDDLVKTTQKDMGEEDKINNLSKLNENDKKVLLELMKNNSITQKEIGNNIGVTSRAVQKIQKKLKELSLIERIGSDKNGHWIVKY